MKKNKKLLATLITASLVVWLTPGNGFGSPDNLIPEGNQLVGINHPVLLADNSKPRKRKKKSSDEQDPTTGSDEKSAEAHAAQIGGTKKPYNMEVSLLSDLTQTSTTTSSGDSSSKSGVGEYSLGVKSLFVMKHRFLLGPELIYEESTSKEADFTTKISSLELDILAQFCFGDIDEDINVFFVEGGLGYGTSQTQNGDSSSSKSSGTKFIAGLGLHHFLDSNVALTGEITLDQATQKPSDGSGTSMTQSIHFLKLGLSLFI